MNTNSAATSYPRQSVLIVDDEPAAIANLRRVISRFPELDIIAEIGDGKTAIQSIRDHQPDIVFLDIEMPEVNGFDVAKATADCHYQLVFVTAYDQYALSAFATRAIDYLLKPVRPALLERCIEKILHQSTLALEALKQQKAESDSLALCDGDAIRVVKHEHLCFIEGIGRYRRIHLTAAGAALHRIPTIVSDTTLDDFETQLNPNQFIRLHRSYIVNKEHILGLASASRRHFVRIPTQVEQQAGDTTEHQVPVSRTKVATVKALLT